MHELPLPQRPFVSLDDQERLAREHEKGSPGSSGEYVADEVARKYEASSKETTQDGNVAYANVPDSKPARYRDGWLPE